MPYSLTDTYNHFEGNCCLHLQSKISVPAGNQTQHPTHSTVTTLTEWYWFKCELKSVVLFSKSENLSYSLVSCRVKWLLLLTSWAEPCLWSIKHSQISLDRHCIISEGEMRRLVTFMISSCESYWGQQVKADDTIRLWILYRFAFRCRLQSFRVRICNGTIGLRMKMIWNRTMQMQTHA